MSDYIPITRELREAMDSDGWTDETTYCVKLSMDMEEFNEHCNKIDALHKSLEDQNAKLREKVLNQRKQLAEVQEAMERRNNGVLKRRWQKKLDALKKENEELCDFNHRLMEAVHRHEDLTLWSTDYTALPLDADGVPIHVGDWITGRWWDAKAKVMAVSSENVYWWEPDGCHWCHAFEVRHYHEPTVADVLREFADEWEDTDAGDPREAEIIERFAKRLMLAEEES